MVYVFIDKNSEADSAPTIIIISAWRRAANSSILARVASMTTSSARSSVTFRAVSSLSEREDLNR